MLQKTNRMTLVEQVALQIQSLIESGKWSVGSRIPAEPELVAQLEVSRNTIREAVRALVHAGLLVTKQGDGTYVCSSSVLGVALERHIKKSSLLETLELRSALEQEAARLAANRRTPEDIDAMLIHLGRCDAAAEAGNMTAYVEADINLHQAIVEATHNRFFIDLYGHMTEAVRMSVESLTLMMAHPNFHQKTHRDVVDAIIAQNPLRATMAVHKYIEQSREDLRHHHDDSNALTNDQN